MVLSGLLALEHDAVTRRIKVMVPIYDNIAGKWSSVSLQLMLLVRDQNASLGRPKTPTKTVFVAIIHIYCSKLSTFVARI